MNDPSLNSFGMFVIGGIVLQLGIAGITGPALYNIRVIENFLIMTVISLFAFYKFDCDYCADKHQRHAVNNLRILSWIIGGWSSVIIHFITSLLMPKIIDPEYDFNITTQTEDHWDEWRRKKEFMERKYVNIEKMTKMLEVGTINKEDDFLLNCMCGDKLIPKVTSSINKDNEKTKGRSKKTRQDVRGYDCSKCGYIVDDDDIIYHCEKGSLSIMGLRHWRGYRLCVDCLEIRRQQILQRDEQRQISKEMIELKQIEEENIPRCKCGQKMILIPANFAFPLADSTSCNVSQCYRYMAGRALVWFCIYDDFKVHSNGFTVCKKCARTGKYSKWLEAEGFTAKWAQEDVGGLEKKSDKQETKLTKMIELAGTNVKSNSIDDEYSSDNEVLNNDDEKEMEYVTPGGPDGNTPQ